MTRRTGWATGALAACALAACGLCLAACGLCLAAYGLGVAGCGRGGEAGRGAPARATDAGAATEVTYHDADVPRPVKIRIQAVVAGCHRDARETTPDLRGAVAVDLDAYAMGAIAQVEVTPLADNMAGVATCAQRTMEQMMLPPAPGPYRVVMQVKVAPPPSASKPPASPN